MGGHYVPMDHELPDKPEVTGIRARTDCEIGTICGRLYLFWSWGDRQSVGGVLLNANLKSLADKCGGDVEFWKAVESVGWLKVVPEGVLITGFESRFGKSARERRRSAEKQQTYRDNQRFGNEPVTRVTDDGNAPVTPRTVTETVTETINPGSGAFAKQVRSDMRSLSLKDLKDTGKLLSIFPEASEDDKRFILGAAERAVEIGKKPVALFVKFIRDNDRGLISGKQADRAEARLRAHRSTGPPRNESVSIGLAETLKLQE